MRLGVLGCASIALRRILPTIAKVPSITLVAVASREREKAEAAARLYNCQAMTGYATLLERDDMDAVYVPLPVALHAEWVEAALYANKHVLVEKPMTMSRARTAELLSLARVRNLVLMENVMFVHHSQHSTVRKLVDDGAIGEPRLFEASFLIPRLSEGDIRYRAELGGGALRELGVYPVRAALHFLGGDLEIIGAALTIGEGDEVDTAGVALLRTRGGVSVQLAFGIDHSYRCFYQLVGSEGRISLDRAFTPPAEHRPVLRVAGRVGNEEER
ncbi:MAG: Gfo/Idh/MocA family protein, partial [Pseudonocardiaceae bacterium]